MKKIAILLFALLAGILVGIQNTYAQKIFSDTKDPFTNVRTISSTLDPLYKVGFTSILQVQTSITILNDSISSYTLSFLVPGVSYQTDKVDSSLKNICLLKDETGNIYTGNVISSVSTNVLETPYDLYGCVFKDEDFAKLILAKVSDIKITTTFGKGGLFQIDKKRQDVIGKQIKVILKFIK